VLFVLNDIVYVMDDVVVCFCMCWVLKLYWWFRLRVSLWMFLVNCWFVFVNCMMFVGMIVLLVF